MHRMLLAILVASLASAGSVHAQRPRAVRPPARWVINGHSVAALGATVSDGVVEEDLKTSTGLGAGVQVGYLVTPRLTAYAGLDIAKQGSAIEGVTGTFGLTHLEAGARLSFPNRGKTLPYLGMWVGRRSLSTTLEDFATGQQLDLSVSGLAAGVSGGVQYYVSPKLALDGGVSVGMGKFGHVKADGRQDDIPGVKNTMTTRLQFGANWYP